MLFINGRSANGRFGLTFGHFHKSDPDKEMYLLCVSLFLLYHLQEIFGMYAFGFTDPTHVSKDWGSIRNLAMKYVAEMQAIQPEGPYFLGGYSAGGLISLEMASIFVENQEQVGLLVLIDSFPWIPEARNNTNVLLKCVSSGIDKIKVTILLNMH